MKYIYVVVGLMVFLTNSSMLQAQEPDTSTIQFLIKASVGNQHEISAGQMAAAKASDPTVKAFGKQMVVDHGKAQEQLLKLAKTSGIDLPAEATGQVVPDPMLKNISGRDFDRLYVHMMVPGHQQTVAMFQTYSSIGKNAGVKNFAQQTLPVLKGHLKMITDLDEKLADASAK